MAAHLHDSVLQTLALIQKHGRRRGARWPGWRGPRSATCGTWLYADRPGAAARSVAGALRAAAAEVEDRHGVPVEVVMRRRRDRSRAARPLVLAAREAMVNAAKHSGAAQVDVYAECDDERRRGVRARPRAPGSRSTRSPTTGTACATASWAGCDRHGGTAVVRTAPGEGTEVRLAMTTGPTDDRQTEDDEHRMAGAHRGRGRRPRDVPRRGERAELGPSRRRASARPPTSTGGRGGDRAASPTWCCSTCTCPAAAAPR